MIDTEDEVEEDNWEWEEFASRLEEEMPSSWLYSKPSNAIADESKETTRERLLKEQGGKTNTKIEHKKYTCNEVRPLFPLRSYFFLGFLFAHCYSLACGSSSFPHHCDFGSCRRWQDLDP